MAANVDAMVNEGVNAFKAGRKEEARALLLKATELDPYNEQAWLWLSGLMDGPDDQRTCLENVLAINPDNERAKQGLAYLTGTTSAGNTSPFAAGTPPPSVPPSSAPTSVEWGASDSPAMPAAWNRPAPVEPTPAALDDWVSNLNLSANDAPAGGTSAFGNSASLPTAVPSPFGDFDVDDETFGDGPFSASPLDLGDDEPADPPRRSPAPPSTPRTTPPERRRRQPRDNGSLLRETKAEEKVDTGESVMFGYIPPEIAATRLPGTHESTPTLLTIGVVIMVLLNLALAVVVMMGILT